MAKTKYFETYQAEQLLRLFDNTDGLDLPVCVEHRDKPDFILSTRSRKIGLETTSFTDEEVMRADPSALYALPECLHHNNRLA